MSNGYSPKYPLQFSAYGGYAQNDNILSVIKQNLKMLLLTIPGERIMYPDLGVGFKKYLFEQSSEDVYEEIRDRIYSQVEEYMPFLNIEEISITPDMQEGNAISVIIYYFINNLSKRDLLALDISN